MKEIEIGQLTHYEREEIIRPCRLQLGAAAKELTEQFQRLDALFAENRDSDIFNDYRNQIITAFKALKAADKALCKF